MGADILLIFFLGTSLGSVLNTVIFRLHRDLPVTHGSVCERCDTPLRFVDTLPLVGYLFTRGRCRSCNQAVDLRHPLVELNMGVLFVCAYLRYAVGFSLPNEYTSDRFILFLLKDWLFVASFFFLGLYAWEKKQLPTRILYPLILLFLGLTLWSGHPWLDLGASALFALVFFLLQYMVSDRRWVSRGDLLTGLLLALALGTRDLLFVLFFGYAMSFLWSLWLVVRRPTVWDGPFPLGVFLCVAAIGVLFTGDVLADWVSAMW